MGWEEGEWSGRGEKMKEEEREKEWGQGWELWTTPSPPLHVSG